MDVYRGVYMEISGRKIVEFIEDVNQILKSEESNIRIYDIIEYYNLGDSCPYTNLDDVVHMIILSQRACCTSTRSRIKKSVLKQWIRIIEIILNERRKQRIQEDNIVSLLKSSIKVEWDDCFELLIESAIERGLDSSELPRFYGATLELCSNDNRYFPTEALERIMYSLLTHGVDICCPCFYSKPLLLTPTTRKKYYSLSIPLYDVLTNHDPCGAKLRQIVFPFVNTNSIENLSSFIPYNTALPFEYQTVCRLEKNNPTDTAYIEFDYSDSCVLSHYKVLKTINDLHPIISRGELHKAFALMTDVLDVKPDSLLPHNRQYFTSILFSNLNRISTCENTNERDHYLEFFRFIFKTGLDVNHKDIFGRYLLNDAVSYRSPELCKLLYEFGADPYPAFALNDRQRIPISPLLDAALLFIRDVTEKRNYSECFSVLLGMGGRLKDDYIADVVKRIFHDSDIFIFGCTERTINRIKDIFVNYGYSRLFNGVVE